MQEVEIGNSKYPALPEWVEDFRKVVVHIWQGLSLPMPTPVQLDIAKFLSDDKIDRKVIEAFRGVGKSYLTVAFVLWKLRLNPELKFLVVSASMKFAREFVSFCKQLLYNDNLFKCMIPEAHQRSASDAFDVAFIQPDKSPTVKAVGITGQMTGSRADYIIFDDVETPNNSLTNEQRMKLSESIKEAAAILKVGGTIIYLGTPQTESSIYNLLGDRGFITRIWTARFPTLEKLSAYGEKLAPVIKQAVEENPEIAGQPTDPKRFNDEELMARELEYGKSGFALQFMLDTALSDYDRYPLKLQDLIIFDLDKELSPEKVLHSRIKENRLQVASCGLQGDYFYQGIQATDKYLPYRQKALIIDPSGRGQDETSYAVMYERDGYLFLMAIGGFTGGYEDNTLNKLANIALSYNVQKVIIESNFGDGMFSKLLLPYLKKNEILAEIIEVRNSTMKEKRIIDTLEPVLNTHRLIVNRTVIETDSISTLIYPENIRHRYMLFYQLTHIIAEKNALSHDDRLDCIAMGAAHFSESMKSDVDVKIKERKEKAEKLELEVIYSEKAPTGKKAAEYKKIFGYVPGEITINPAWKDKTKPLKKYDIRNRPRGKR